jgi:hypothetical protein
MMLRPNSMKDIPDQIANGLDHFNFPFRSELVQKLLVHRIAQRQEVQRTFCL